MGESSRMGRESSVLTIDPKALAEEMSSTEDAVAIARMLISDRTNGNIMRASTVVDSAHIVAAALIEVAKQRDGWRKAFNTEDHLHVRNLRLDQERYDALALELAEAQKRIAELTSAGNELADGVRQKWGSVHFDVVQWDKACGAQS